jgi:hypothetical protein
MPSSGKRRWLVPVRILEYGRVVLVEADSKAEARAKARRAEWIDGGAPESFDVTSKGPITEEES